MSNPEAITSVFSSSPPESCDQDLLVRLLGAFHRRGLNYSGTMEYIQRFVPTLTRDLYEEFCQVADYAASH